MEYKLMNTGRSSNRGYTRVVRNERMTAFAGAILFVLIVIELFITANLHALISVHIFVGVLLSGPLIVKMCSTGYRFFRFYTRSAVFVQKGPPNIWLRLLAPFLVIITVLVFISGFGLAVVGPTHTGLFFKIHAVSVTLWLPLIAVHIYAHIRKVPRQIANDWSKKSEFRVPGRASRIGINSSALVVGFIAAIVMIPVSTPWRKWHIHGGLPSPLALGIVAAVFAVLISIPLLRKTSKR
ncbi:hypothetical protein NZD89_28285 (plasmid) [Alicyclobacillus fastidiosus]|uniref:DUF4405 domain-containing protein n=1 Tax=Alicyclobacillus fastidiosus TaxID=392011 RepID=A0ABY6ZSL8_9BACL|nr:hypothetical protein [Alicyclobacillus fastidiosus]WAH44945.1 hypothetical protein NZD89_28285 [Alicyclobacillus fastidiosus]